MNRVGVFVHINNQFYAVNTQYRGRKVDYAKYLGNATIGRTLSRAFAYGVQMGDEARDFIAYLRHVGFEPKYKPAKVLDGRPSIRHTDWNVGLAMDVMRHLHKLDEVVIGANLSELVPLVQYIKERGVKVVIFSCKVGTELREAADEVVEIDEDVLEKRTEPCPA